LAETNAETAETNAVTAQLAAESARDSALAAYDNFDDRYLGAKTSDPTLDNDGDALVAGALYFNSVDGAMRVYTGSVWVDAYAAGQTFLAKVNNLSDLPNVATARQNLDLEIGVDVQAFDATILKSADIGVTVQGYDVDTAKYDDVTANFTGTLQNGGSNVLVDNDIGVTVQAYDSTIVVDADIGVTVQGYDADTAKLDVAQSWTATQTFNSGIATDTVSEKTSAAGVTVDGVLLKDSQVTTDQINEKTSAAGVTIDGVLLKDNGVVTGAGTVSAPVYSTTGDTNTGIFFPAADTIAFAEGGAEAMRIDSSGNVGIGTSTPTTQLSISQNAASGGNNLNVLSRTHLGGTYSSGSLVLGYSVKADTTTNDRMIGTETNSGGGAPAAILMNSGVIQFHTNSSITSGAAFSSERARIDSSGNLLVGTTNTAQNAGNGTKIYPRGNVSVVNDGTTGGGDGFDFYNSTAGAYRFYVTGAGTIFATTTTISAISDQRLKENVRDLDVGLDAVMALKPRKFDWKEGKGKNVKDDRGWIAQEFEQVFPDLVDEWKDPSPDGEEPYKSVRADLIPVLVKAIQELKAELDEAKARIAALEGSQT
jgi:predicted outer membrane repeat protein